MITSNASLIQCQIQDAFFNDEGGLITQSLLDDIEGPMFPTIVNTRSGSTIVDYVVNFNSTMWDNNATAIVSETMALIESSLPSSVGGDGSSISNGPIVTGSIVVSSACTSQFKS